MSELRLATETDVPALAALHVLGWQAAYRGLMPDDYLDGLDPCDRQVTWRELLATGTVALVAESEGALTGFASYGPSREVEGAGELYALYVAPAAWGTAPADVCTTRLWRRWRRSTDWRRCGCWRATPGPKPSTSGRGGRPTVRPRARSGSAPPSTS